MLSASECLGSATSAIASDSDVRRFYQWLWSWRVPSDFCAKGLKKCSTLSARAGRKFWKKEKALARKLPRMLLLGRTCVPLSDRLKDSRTAYSHIKRSA